MYRVKRSFGRGMRRGIGRDIGAPFVLRFVRITEASDTRITEVSDTRITEQSS